MPKAADDSGPDTGLIGVEPKHPASKKDVNVSIKIEKCECFMFAVKNRKCMSFYHR